MLDRSDIAARRARIDAAFNRFSGLPDDELKSDFARYLCVLVSGFLESSVAELAVGYCRKTSSNQVLNYIERGLRRPGNFNAERLLQFVSSFEPGWRTVLAEFVQGERKAALDAVLANRNQIAHGGLVDITHEGIKGYYRHICDVVDFVESNIFH